MAGRNGDAPMEFGDGVVNNNNEEDGPENGNNDRLVQEHGRSIDVLNQNILEINQNIARLKNDVKALKEQSLMYTDMSVKNNENVDKILTQLDKYIRYIKN